MKKKTILTLALLLGLTIGMTGCSSNSNNTNDNTTKNVTTNNQNKSKKKSESTNSHSSESHDEKQVLYDKDNIYVEYRGLSKDGNLNFYIENKTDNELCMDVDNLIINGWSIEAANGMADITPQSKYLTEQHNDFAIDEDDLEECDIDVIESIKFEFQIMDSSWDTIETIPVDLKTNIKLG